MILQLEGLLLLVNQAIAEAESQIAAQRTRIRSLEIMGLPAVEEQKTLDTMDAVALALRDNQLAIERLISGKPEKLRPTGNPL